jgi:hypothetical protein
LVVVSQLPETQSALPAQAVRQVDEPPHMNGAQWATGTAGAHVPTASQNWASWSDVPDGQVSPLHWVVAGQSWQPPAPSQTPSGPQVEAGVAASVQVPDGSAPPAGMGVQAPCAPATPQLEQDPQLALPQQKPSVQWVLAHWLSAVQATPARDRGTQLPPAPV